MEERVAELERKMERLVKAMKILSEWIEAHMELTDCDTKILDRLNERVSALEDVGRGWG